MSVHCRLRGWGGRIRTSVWRNQNPLPYHLATPQRSAAHGDAKRADHSVPVDGPQYAQQRNAPSGVDGKSIRPPTSRAGCVSECPLPGRSCVAIRPAFPGVGPWPSCRSVAQPGSAPRSGRGGRRFESSHSDHSIRISAQKAASGRPFAFRSTDLSGVRIQRDGKPGRQGAERPALRRRGRHRSRAELLLAPLPYCAVMAAAARFRTASGSP